MTEAQGPYDVDWSARAKRAMQRLVDMKSDELLVTAFAASRLRMELDRIPLWRGDHVLVKQVVEDFVKYLYLPLLIVSPVLLNAMGDGVGLLTWAQDAFAFADSYDEDAGRYTFCDCSAESPTGRRSVCYDREARESRKENRPESSAVEMAAAMGIDLLTEEQYRELQKLGDLDTKTSSWVETPSDVRALGGALFCDRRYGRVFVYHNGAQSYYAARGFRGSLRA